MSTALKLDPLIYEFDTKTDAESYDVWFRAKVEKSMNDTFFQIFRMMKQWRSSMRNWNAERLPVLPVEWKTAARLDLVEIVDYIAQDNPSAADKMKFLIYEAAERLGEMPYINRRGRVSGTREKSPTRTTSLFIG